MDVFNLRYQELIDLTIRTFRNVQQFEIDTQSLIQNKSYSYAIALITLGIEEWVKGIVFLQISLKILTKYEIDAIEPKIIIKQLLKDHESKIEIACQYAFQLYYPTWMYAKGFKAKIVIVEIVK